MMTHAQLATASLDDIVFDGRNKHYGAYELRHVYERHVRRAVIIATALLALLLAFPIIASMLREPYVYTPPKKAIAEPITIVMPDIKPPVTPPSQPAAAAAAPAAKPAKPTNTVQFTQTVKVARDVETTIPDVEMLAKKDPGTASVDGPKTPEKLEEAELPVGKPGGGGGGGLPSNAPYTYVEQMPELPGGGGAAAIVAAIQRAVNYPPLAVRNGVEGKLFASFVVNEKGDITDIKIVKGLGSGLDEETMRAIRTLPRFIPGRQNGRAVSVSYTVPLNFNIR